MGLQIAKRQAGNVMIVDVAGRATIGLGNDLLNNSLRQIAESGARKVLLNLAGLTQMDSSGISTVVRAYVTFERLGGSLKLLRPTGHVREVLELTRLLQAIPNYDDEAKALASFA